MRRTCAPAKRSATSPEPSDLTGARPSRARVISGDIYGRPEFRSDRAATVHGSGARCNLCAVRYRPVADLRHADSGELRAWRLLYGWSLCRAVSPLAGGVLLVL